MYLAVVCGRTVDNVENFVDYLLKDSKKNMSKIVEKGTTGAKRAELRYRVVDKTEAPQPLALVEVELFTGRHHQIRVQFAGHGLPLWGDRRYNPAFAAGEKGQQGESVALYASRLSFVHPSTGRHVVFQAEPQGELFRRFAEAMGQMRDVGRQTAVMAENGLNQNT